MEPKQNDGHATKAILETYSWNLQMMFYGVLANLSFLFMEMAW